MKEKVTLVDSSQYRLDEIELQDNHTVAYPSATLNDQHRYSQIGKEILAILIE